MSSRSTPASTLSAGAFRALVEAAPFGIHLYQLEPDGRLVITGTNTAADRILGVESTRLLGKTTEEAFEGAEQTAIPDQLRKVTRTGVPWKAVHSRGTGAWIGSALEVHAFPIGASEVAVAFRDITELTRERLALAFEKERLAVTLCSIGDAVMTTDAVGRVTLMNPPAEVLTGWTAAEAEGRPLADVFQILSEKTGLRLPDPAERVLAEGRVIGLANDTVLVARDGTRRPIADSAAPIHGPGSDILGVVLAFRDHTAERNAEALLLDSEARNRTVERSVPMVQWATDLEGVFTLSDGLGLASMGLKPGQVVGRAVREVYRDQPDFLAVFQAGFARARSGESLVTENRVRGRVLETAMGPIRNDAGDIVGVTGLARDVTSERALRERVVRAERLESLGRLAGGVAHDFNNLLTVVLSCAEILREQTAAGAPACAEDIEQIVAAGERARDLVRQLLSFASKQAVVPEPTDLRRVLRSVEGLLHRVLGDDVQLVMELDPELWPVLCDPGQLEQVFLNLAVNGRDAMAGAGRLTIRAANVPGGAGRGGERGDCVRVEVADTGTGMSPEVKEHLFEPFFTTKAPGSGTGLGLSIVDGVVSQCGGRIQVESQPGAGTTFVLSFPRCYQAAVTRAAHQAGGAGAPDGDRAGRGEHHARCGGHDDAGPPGGGLPRDRRR